MVVAFVLDKSNKNITFFSFHHLGLMAWLQEFWSTAEALWSHSNQEGVHCDQPWWGDEGAFQIDHIYNLQLMKTFTSFPGNKVNTFQSKSSEPNHLWSSHQTKIVTVKVSVQWYFIGFVRQNSEFDKLGKFPFFFLLLLFLRHIQSKSVFPPFCFYNHSGKESWFQPVQSDSTRLYFCNIILLWLRNEIAYVQNWLIKDYGLNPLDYCDTNLMYRAVLFWVRDFQINNQ